MKLKLADERGYISGKGWSKQLRARARAKNSTDWWVVDYKDGETRLVHKMGLSCILECGHSMSEYDIVKMEQCGCSHTQEEVSYEA